MAFSIERNVGGVMGLHLARNVFSLAEEERLFAIHGADTRGETEKFVDLNAHPFNFPEGVARVAPLRCAWLSTHAVAQNGMRS